MMGNITNQDLLALKNFQMLSLTNSVSGSAGTCEAKASTGIIQIKITTATDAKRATATIHTPFPFEIVGIHVIGDTVTTSKELEVAVRNGTAVIVSNVGLGTDNLFKGVLSLNRTYATFAKDDNDLVVTLSGTSIGVAVVVLHILHT